MLCINIEILDFGKRGDQPFAEDFRPSVQETVRDAGRDQIFAIWKNYDHG